MTMYKQIIIARKDLDMSPGKLATQVSHGSMAFLTDLIKKKTELRWRYLKSLNNNVKEYFYVAANIECEVFEQWIDGEFTKCVLQAKNKNQLLKAKTMAEELGMKEEEDFWLIFDNCHTELEPEEDGRTLTVIGFKPMDSKIIDQIGRKYHLYV